MRHAFLIIAHNEPEVLSVLLRQLDAPDFDVFLHIDARATSMRERFSRYKPVVGRFFMLEHPQAVCWGDVGQMEVELRLFREAAANGPYVYYHLLSGTDLLLKPWAEVKRRFEENAGQEFVGFWNTAAHRRDLRRKVSRYYFFTRHLKDKGTWAHRLTAPCRNLVLTLQKLTGFRRPDCGFEFRKGSNWVSITENFCQYLLSQEPRFRLRFRHTLCPDEIFLQTVLWNSPFRQNIHDAESEDLEQTTLRKIDWQRGSPYVWQAGDADELLKSAACFARKFSSRQMAVVRAISEQTF